MLGVPSSDLRRALHALAAALAVAIVVPTSAHGFELFGIRFFETQQEDEALSPDARPYVLDFQVIGGDAALTERLQAASQLHADQETVPPSLAALLARGRRDYSRILAALYGAGRYGGTITILAAGREVGEVAADAVLPDPVPITVIVDPGPLFVFGDVRISGRPGPVAPSREVPETPEELGLVPGGVARSNIVLQSEKALVNRWRQLSYAKAQIAQRETVARHPTNTLDVAVAVDPGRPAVYGPVRVTGTEHMNPAFVARHTGLAYGEPFDPDDLELAREQLRRLQVFQAVRIIEGDEIGPDGTLPMAVQVAERPLRVFGFGGSYSTLDGVGIEGYWEHRNLFGQAERLRVEGRVGRIGSNSVEDYDYFAGVTLVKPGVITPFTDLTARVIAEQERPESYLAQRAAAQVGLSHRFSDTLTASLGTNLEASRIEDPLGTRNFLLASLPAELVYDGRDDELNPTEGYRALIRAEPFYEFDFGNAALITEAEASTYYGLDARDRFILAARAGIGSIAGAPRDEIPANRLFFAGGGQSIRGYAYRNVGPRLPSGEVIGGRSYVEGSVELRAQLTETIGVVPFVDFGNAFESSFPDFSEDLKVGAGVGLRYFTGLGPIRVDVAFPVDPEPGDPDFALYLGLGHAF